MTVAGAHFRIQTFYSTVARLFEDCLQAHKLSCMYAVYLLAYVNNRVRPCRTIHSSRTSIFACSSRDVCVATRVPYTRRRDAIAVRRRRCRGVDISCIHRDPLVASRLWRYKQKYAAHNRRVRQSRVLFVVSQC